MTGWLTPDGSPLALHIRGQGAPVLFQHGLCGDARQTFEAFPDLAGHRLMTLECRGHGQSSPAGPFSIATFADDVIGVIDSLGQSVVLGGISMGAAISTRIAVLRPDLVRALILVRPAWVAESAPANMQPNAEVGGLIARSGAAGRADFADGPTAQQLAAEAPDNLTSLLGFFDRQPPDVTAALLQAISADGPGVTEADLRSLDLPALVCGTDQDAIHPMAMTDRMAALLPRARLTRLPPKGRDKPAHLAALHAAIADFLKELPDAQTRR